MMNMKVLLLSFVFIVIGLGIALTAQSIADDSRYGDIDENSEQEMGVDRPSFTYYEIKIDNVVYRCVSYEKVSLNEIKLIDVFMENNNAIWTSLYSEEIIIFREEIEYIKKRRAESKKKLIIENNQCFINSMLY